MKTKRSVYLTLLAVLLSPMAASATPILVSGVDVNARLEIFNNDEIVSIDDGDWLVSFVEGSYEAIAPLLQEQIWWDSVSQTRADTALFVGRAFAEIVGPVSGVNNLSFGLGPMFLADNYLEENLLWVSWSNGDWSEEGASSFIGS